MFITGGVAAAPHPSQQPSPWEWPWHSMAKGTVWFRLDRPQKSVILFSIRVSCTHLWCSSWEQLLDTLHLPAQPHQCPQGDQEGPCRTTSSQAQMNPQAGKKEGRINPTRAAPACFCHLERSSQCPNLQNNSSKVIKTQVAKHLMTKHHPQLLQWGVNHQPCTVTALHRHPGLPSPPQSWTFSPSQELQPQRLWGKPQRGHRVHPWLLLLWGQSDSKHWAPKGLKWVSSRQ